MTTGVRTKRSGRGLPPTEREKITFGWEKVLHDQWSKAAAPWAIGLTAPWV